MTSFTLNVRALYAATFVQVGDERKGLHDLVSQGRARARLPESHSALVRGPVRTSIMPLGVVVVD